MSTGSTTAETGAARFSRHVAWTLGVKLLIAGGSMLSGVIIARWLGAAAVGTLASLTVISMLTISLGLMGTPSAATYLVARDRHRAAAIVFQAVVFGVLAGVALGLGIALTTYVMPDLFGDIPRVLVLITACFIPFQILTVLSLAVFLGLNNIGRYNLIDLLSQASLVINPLVAIALLGLGLTGLVTLNTITAFILSVVVLTILFRTVGLRPGSPALRYDQALLGEMLGYGSKFYISLVASVIILRADLLIVNYFRGVSEAGSYAVAAQVGTLLLLVPNVISTVLFPRVTEAQDTSGEMTCRVTRHTAMIMLIACIMSIPLLFLLPVLYGSSFAAVPYQVLILLPGIYLLGIETVQIQYFSSLGLPRSIPIYWVCTMAINIALDVVFVPRFGAYAAATVSSLSYALMFFLVARLFRRRTGKSIQDAFVLHASELRSLFITARTFTGRPVEDAR